MKNKPILPAPGTGKRGESGYLGYLLRQAGAAYRLHAERTLAAHGVTLPQFSVLTMLNAYPGASNAELARLSLLTPQTVNVIIANLDKAGLVTRQPHATHGRVLEITLTDQGQARLKACRTAMHGEEQRLAHGLSSDEEQVVRRWLAGLARGLSGEDQ